MTRIDDVLLAEANACQASRVKDAMLYSLMAGGKRIRPNLLYEVVKGYGLEESCADGFACALEMIQTYSLIHDDLPAMDNDDLRRGKPTCHKQFDEATAILAGDGLLTHAFYVAAKSSLPGDVVARCIAILSECAGPNGMVLGQDLDMQEESNVTNWDMLKTIHHYKTGCLLSAPLQIGSSIAQQSETTTKTWKEVGLKIGLAFQIQDDVMDVTKTSEQLGKSNSDERNEKVTSVSLLGLEAAQTLMNQLYEESCETIQQFEGFNSSSLITFIKAIQTRNM